ncbi:MAG TPA: cell division protein FtsA [Candidatus Acidoferrales bacterium]|nr:cell division protein FtsA [Candidatus Acidoferrales bacterium]
MAKKANIVVGVDIGSSKVCVLIAGVPPADERTSGNTATNGSQATLECMGVGVADSKGLRKGLIVNLEATKIAVERALEQAEDVAGVAVEFALVGVAGAHIRGVNSRGGITLGARPRDVQREDMQRAIDGARGVSLPEDRVVLHVFPQEFFLDGQDNIRQPVGLLGQKLEANVHIVTASATAEQNLVSALNLAGIKVSATVLEPFAAAEASLTPEEREQGCCLLDLGAATTEMIVITDGVVRHTAAIPVGGDHFTNDLAVGLRTPVPEAEALKREHACVFRELLRGDSPIEISSVGGRPPRTVFSRMLTDIAEPRATELLELVHAELKHGGLDSRIAAGVVLTGGGARLRGLPDLVERLFGVPVRLGRPRGIARVPEEFAHPEFTVAAGLALYGHRAQAGGARQQSRSAGWRQKWKEVWKG